MTSRQSYKSNVIIGIDDLIKRQKNTLVFFSFILLVLLIVIPLASITFFHYIIEIPLDEKPGLILFAVIALSCVVSLISVFLSIRGSNNTKEASGKNEVITFSKIDILLLICTAIMVLPFLAIETFTSGTYNLLSIKSLSAALWVPAIFYLILMTITMILYKSRATFNIDPQLKASRLLKFVACLAVLFGIWCLIKLFT